MPAMAELEGRMIGIIPTQLTMEPVKNASGAPTGEMKPTITCNVMVFGTGTFDYGAREGKMGAAPSPVRRRVTLPYRLDHWVFSNQEMVKAVRDFVPAQGQQPSSIVIGVVTRSTFGQKPWQLEVPPQTDARWAPAIDFMNGLKEGRYVLQPPIALNENVPDPAAPNYGGVQMPAQAGQPQYTVPAQQAPPQYAQPQLAPPQYTAPVAGALPALPMPPGFPAPAIWAGMDRASQESAWAIAQQAQAAAPPAAPAAPAFDLSRPVAGLEAYWGGMTEQARLQAWTQASNAQP